MATLAKTAGWGMVLCLSAYFMALAQHSTDLRLLGWITLIPLFLAIRVLTPGRAALAGVFWGFCLCLFSSFGAHATLPLTVRSLVFLALVPGVYAFAGARQTRRVGFSPLLLGLGWIAVELALKPLALRHGLLAGTQSGGLAIRAIGNVAGWFVVAFVIAYVNASLLEILGGVCTSPFPSRVAAHAGGRDVRVASPDLSVRILPLFSPAQPRGPPA